MAVHFKALPIDTLIKVLTGANIPPLKRAWRASGQSVSAYFTCVWRCFLLESFARFMPMGRLSCGRFAGR
jgi:hypothetical protein